MNAPLISIYPGEDILANRVRQCIPASVRERLLPASDEQLVHRMRNALRVTALTVKNAHVWLRVFVHEHSDEFDSTEKQLFQNRVRTHFTPDGVGA